MTFISQILYNLSIQFLRVFIYLVGFVNPKAKLRSQGNNHWKSLSINSGQLAWFHCASLGEFEQGRPVLEAFKNQYPHYKILLTFFSPSGYEIRKSFDKADFITYLPLDTPSNAKNFIEYYRPSIAFFVKYEFWRNFALELAHRKIPLISFSTIFREDQIYFKSWGGFPRQTLHAFDHFFVQNKESRDLLRSVGLEKVSLAGDTRYDRVKSNRDLSKPIQVIETFVSNSEAIVIGSAWQQDMDVLIPIINDPVFAEKKFIIAPHEINQKEIEKWASQISPPVQRYSTYNPKSEAQVLFIDNIGMLSAIYQYGYAAFVGGAFGKGLHNILEAAVYEIPVFFGNKNYHKFQEANELLTLGSAKAISNFLELKDELLALENLSVRKTIREKNTNFIQHHLGATQKVIDYCSTLLKK